MNWYIADLHFGHKNIITMDNRPFINVEEMDTILIENWNRKVQPNDNVYILGDMCCFSKRSPAWYLEQLKGKKYLIQGNHDGKLVQDADSRGYLETVEKMCFVKDGREQIVLCHFPLAEWNGFYRGAWHIYGHIHNSRGETYQYMKQKEKAMNAGCMINDYAPASFEELIENNRVFQQRQI